METLPENPNGKDLEVIVQLIELAAIYLTNKPNDTFTFEELFNQACEIGGSEISLDKADFRIVVNTSRFLKKTSGRYFLK